MTHKTFVNAKYTVKVMVGWLTWPAVLSDTYNNGHPETLTQKGDEIKSKLLHQKILEAIKEE